MNFSKYLLLFIFLLLNLVSGNKSMCEENILNNRLTLSVFLGSNIPILSSGFLKEYKSQLGGTKDEFQTYWGIGGALGYQLNKNIRVSLNTEYILNTLQDNFIKEITKNSGQWRSYQEDMELSTIPIIISVQKYLFFEKYKSYFGIGAGASYSSFKWSESVTSPLHNDKRIGGTIYNTVNFYPTLRAEAGIDLDWDVDRPNVFMKSVSISAVFYYVIRYPKVYKNLESQIVPFPDDLKGRKGVVPFMIGVNLGLTFNIEKYVINQ